MPVYALFGEAEIRDDSVDGAGRHRHRHEVAVIARPGSVRTALDAAARMASLLTEPDLPLQGCRLVTLRVSADDLLSVSARHPTQGTIAEMDVLLL